MQKGKFPGACGPIGTSPGCLSDIRHPESDLAADQHVGPLRLPVVPDAPVDSTRLRLCVNLDPRSCRQRIPGPDIHFVSRLRPRFVLQGPVRPHVFWVCPRNPGVHFFRISTRGDSGISGP